MSKIKIISNRPSNNTSTFTNKEEKKDDVITSNNPFSRIITLKDTPKNTTKELQQLLISSTTNLEEIALMIRNNPHFLYSSYSSSDNDGNGGNEYFPGLLYYLRQQQLQQSDKMKVCGIIFKLLLVCPKVFMPFLYSFVSQLLSYAATSSSSDDDSLRVAVLNVFYVFIDECLQEESDLNLFLDSLYDNLKVELKWQRRVLVLQIIQYLLQQVSSAQNGGNDGSGNGSGGNSDGKLLLQLLLQTSSVSANTNSNHLVELIQQLKQSSVDTKRQVEQQTQECFQAIIELYKQTDLYDVSSNNADADDDEEKSTIKRLIMAVMDIDQIPQAVKALYECTFVKDIDVKVLSIVSIILHRGFRYYEQTHRMCVVIVGNLLKIVKQKKKKKHNNNNNKKKDTLSGLLLGLVKEVKSVCMESSDPEVRQLSQEVLNQEKQVEVEDEEEEEDVVEDVATVEEVTTGLKQKVQEVVSQSIPFSTDSNVELLKNYLVDCISCDLMNGVGMLKQQKKKKQKKKKLKKIVVGDYYECCTSLKQFQQQTEKEGREKYQEMIHESLKLVGIDLHLNNNNNGDEDDDDDSSVDDSIICNCVFSLAYGGLVLLKDAQLMLRRGEKYALCGRNGVGKSTLLKALSSDGKVDGFPTELKVVYVSHIHHSDDPEDKSNILQHIKKKVQLKQDDDNDDDKSLIELVQKYGFTKDILQWEYEGLSGGWKMKVELMISILKNADILLLDEPTNHLDSTNVQWLKDYLNGNHQLTSIIVSHDVSFMNDVCGNVMHFHDLKLKNYEGNFDEFVRMIPEAKGYIGHSTSSSSADSANSNGGYDDDTFVFKFPVCSLEGVRSKEKKILKLSGIKFGYSEERLVLKDVSLGVSLSSRIAIVGPNGAGKSTLVKVLIGDLKPSSGELYRHPSLRIAHLAQHAFYHLEQHMEKSPNQYIKWRFENGIDKELLEKETKKVDKEQMVKHGIELICGRQKLKRSYKYEVKYIGKSFNDTRWVPKEDLEEMGLLRLCEQYDDYEAARLANAYLPELNTNAVEKHLESFGIIKEIGTYSTIKGLSGGQKVKVVLAAAMWILPHVLILDEPTNYLDVQSMQALKAGIREFSGGVMMVTHNKEFYENLCDEVWEMDSGYLKCRRNRAGEVSQVETPDDSIDGASANGSSQEQLDKSAAPEKEEKERKPRIKKLTRKEKLKKEKIREAKLNKYGPKPDGTPWSSDEEVETNIVIGSVNVAKSG